MLCFFFPSPLFSFFFLSFFFFLLFLSGLYWIFYLDIVYCLWRYSMKDLFLIWIITIILFGNPFNWMVFPLETVTINNILSCIQQHTNIIWISLSILFLALFHLFNYLYLLDGLIHCFFFIYILIRMLLLLKMIWIYK